MNLIEMCEKDQLIMKVLKISEISHILAKTNKGDLTLKLIFGEKDYKFFLDAVPMEDKENKQLIKLFEGILYTTEEEIKLTDIYKGIAPQFIPIDDTIDTTQGQVTTATDNIAKIIEETK